MLFQVEEIVTWRDWDAYRIASALHGKVTGSIMRGLWGFQRALGLFFAVFGGALAGWAGMCGDCCMKYACESNGAALCLRQ